MLILVLNCGSSSLKCELFNTSLADKSGGFQSVFKASAECLGTIDEGMLEMKFPRKETVYEGQALSHKVCIEWVLNRLSNIGLKPDVVAHRLVHGGRLIKKATLINEHVLEKLEKISELAPLHNPIALAGVRIVTEIMPVRQYVVADTGFLQAIPQEQHRYAVPEELYEIGVQKYGAHGTNYAYLVRKLHEQLGKKPTGILAHLGQGASICAVKNGRPIYTSMQFTPLTGMIMGTRCGTIDPTVIPFIMKKTGSTIEQILKTFNKESGLLALAGSNDIRNILHVYEQGNPKAKMALQMFVDSVAKEIASGIIALQEMPKCIVFSAGIGQNSPVIREMVCNLLQKSILFGLRLNKVANEENEFKISSPSSLIDVYIIPAGEELEIANQTFEAVLSTKNK